MAQANGNDGNGRVNGRVHHTDTDHPHALKKILDPQMRDGSNFWNYVMAWLLVGKDKVKGLTEEMIAAREMIKSLAIELYRMHDAGETEEAWKMRFLVTVVCKPELAITMSWEEMEARAKVDPKAKALLGYAKISDKEPIWWLKDGDTIVVETYGQAAERHLRAIVNHPVKEVASSAMIYRKSMVEAGLLTKAEAKQILSGPVPVRKERENVPEAPIVAAAPAPVGSSVDASDLLRDMGRGGDEGN